MAAAVGGNTARFDCNLRGEGILNKKLYESHPLFFAEKSPHKIFRINLETPCIMRLLVREIFKSTSLSTLQKILLNSTSDYS